MTNYDHRQAPTLKKFNLESGADIKQFFRTFERYCKDNIRGGEEFWINILKEHMEGSMEELFDQLVDQDYDYREAKHKLIRWCRDSEDMRKRKQKKSRSGTGTY